MKLLSRLPVLDRKLLRELWKIRGQALAIAAVIGAGLALYILTLSTLASLSVTQQTYYERYRFADVFASLERAPNRLERRIESLPGVDRVRTRVVVSVKLDLEDLTEPTGGLIVSIPESQTPMLNDVYLRSGRYLEPGRRDEVLASEGFARAHGLEPGDSVTAIINGRQRELEIVGLALSPEFIYNIRPGELIPDEATYGVFWMGRPALAAAYDLEGSFNDVVLTLTREASEPEVIGRLDDLLEPFGGLGAIPRRLQASHWYLNNELVQLETMGDVIPAIFLAVAAFLLNIVLTRIVTVQREEIAAVKAVGYSNRALAFHYVKWSLLVAVAGVLLGTLFGGFLGRGMTSMYAEFFNFPILHYELPPHLILQSLLISAVAAIVGALAAVRRAVSLPPAEAMRPEPPASFRKTIIERIGLGPLLSQPSRILLRNLQRNPGRAGASLLGIAAGGSLLILGSFSLDAIDVMLDLEFNVAQRQDLQVTLYHPLASTVVHELQRLPGTIEVEPFRTARVRLRHGHRERQTLLNGVSEEARLNRLVDAEVGPISIPPEGLAISAKLAEILDVLSGDELEIEVLEGRRGRGRLPVTRVIDDFMGTSAYMEEGALHRFLDEGDDASGAYLTVDSSAVDELYRRLKETPGVAAVVRKQATLESFDKAMGETIGTIRAINILFASIIAFGVVYNAARVSLSERGRELATLRVIGFRRSEISYILLGELAVITVLAIPLSLIAGYGLAAATADAMSSEVFRIPLVVSARTYSFSAVVIVVATVISSLIVRRRLNRLDLIAVLKTRE